MKKFDVAAIGELNVDLILNKIDGEPEIGKEKFAEDMILTLGSSTAIFAANISSLGSRTAFVGMIGNDIFGELIKSSLKAKHVDISKLTVSDKHASGATICLNYNEDRANVTYQGAMDYMSFADIDKSLFQETKHIHLSSLFMQSGLKKDILEILKYANKQNVTTSLDTQWDPVEKWDLDYKQILPLTDVFLPNRTELKLLTGKETVEEAIEEVKPYLKNILVVKCGNEGSILIQKGKPDVKKEAFLNKDVVDAIGAGDSFNAGFVHAFIKGYSAEECQMIGNLTGAINTTAAGGTGAFTSKSDVIETAKNKFGQTILL